MKDWGINPREKETQTTGENAAYLASNGRQDRGRNPVLTSFTQFQILVLQILKMPYLKYSIFLSCVHPSNYNSFPCPISSLWGSLWQPTQIATCSLLIMNQSSIIALGDFTFRWVSYSNSYSQGYTK